MSKTLCSVRCAWMAWIVVLGVCLVLAGCAVPGPVPDVTTPVVPTSSSGLAITGRVLWGDAPVASARVEMRTGAWAEPLASQVVAQSVADAEGNFALEAPLGSDEFGLVALWPDGGANPAPVTPVRIAPDDRRIKADVALARELVWLEPAPGAEVSNTPTLRWEGLPSVDHYQLWVVDQGTTELVFDLNMTENTASEQRVVLPPLTPDRTYTWDVQGRSADDTLLARRIGEFRVAAPAAAAWSQPQPPVSDDLAYTRVAVAEAGLVVEVPAGWRRLEPEWAWTPDEEGTLRVGLRWANLPPPQEAEAVLLPTPSVVLSSQPVTLGGGDGRLITVAIFRPAEDGAHAEIRSVETHALGVSAHDGTRRALSLYLAAPDEAQAAAQRVVLQHMLDSLDMRAPDSEQ